MMRRGASVAGLTDGSPAWRLEGERSAGCRRAPQAPVGRPRPDTGLASRPMAGLSAVPMGGAIPVRSARKQRPWRAGQHPAPVPVGSTPTWTCTWAAVLDHRGRRWTPGVPGSTRGGVALVSWAERPGAGGPIGVEAPGTYRAGRLARADGLHVVQVNRPTGACGGDTARRIRSTLRPRPGRPRPGWPPPAQDPGGSGRADPGAGWLGGGPQGPGGSRRAAIRAAVQRSRGAGPTTARAHDQAWSPPGPRRGPGP